MNRYQVLREETSINLTNISEQVYLNTTRDHVLNRISEKCFWKHNNCFHKQANTSISSLQARFFCHMKTLKENSFLKLCKISKAKYWK